MDIRGTVWSGVPGEQTADKNEITGRYWDYARESWQPYDVDEGGIIKWTIDSVEFSMDKQGKCTGPLLKDTQSKYGQTKNDKTIPWAPNYTEFMRKRAIDLADSADSDGSFDPAVNQEWERCGITYVVRDADVFWTQNEVSYALTSSNEYFKLDDTSWKLLENHSGIIPPGLYHDPYTKQWRAYKIAKPNREHLGKMVEWRLKSSDDTTLVYGIESSDNIVKCKKLTRGERGTFRRLTATEQARDVLWLPDYDAIVNGGIAKFIQHRQAPA